MYLSHTFRPTTTLTSSEIKNLKTRNYSIRDINTSESNVVDYFRIDSVDSQIPLEFIKTPKGNFHISAYSPNISTQNNIQKTIGIISAQLGWQLVSS